jgi:predicted small metal-binding protein
MPEVQRKRDSATSAFSLTVEGFPMKSMTCRQLGGACDQQLSANSWDEMVKVMTKHVMEKHPDVAKSMEKMYNEDPKQWGREMRPKWDAAPAI